MEKQVTVLIVEDSRTQAYQLQSRLKEFDINVLVAYDGEEGLRLAFEHIPDAIVLDINLPRMNGYQVCQRLKRGERTRLIPVILLTGMSDDYIDESRSMYDGRYVRKPSDRASFNHVVADFFERAAEPVALEDLQDLVLPDELFVPGHSR